MPESHLKFFFQISSLSFLVTIIILTSFTFNFLDIFIFESTRSFHGFFFFFFKEIIDPISDILDPLNIIIFCLLIILLNINIKYLLKNDIKLKLLKEKTKFSVKKINDSFEYYALVCKHFIWSLAIAGISCNLIKYIMGVARPKYFFLEGFERIDFFNLYHKTNSFPSGHTQAAFTLALLLMLYLRKYYLIIFLFAMLMGLSRIFMSMHFPSDIIFGAYLGSVIPILLYKKIYMHKFNKYRRDDLANFSQFLKLIYWRVFI